MRTWIVLALLLAGCSAPSVDGPPDGGVHADDGGDAADAGGGGRQDRSGSGQGPPAGGEDTGRLDGFVRDGDGAVAGARVTVGTTGLETVTATDGSFAFDAPPGRHRVRAELDGRNGSVTVDLQAGGARTIFIDLGTDTVAPSAPVAALGTFTCPDGNVTEPHLTHGQADGMAWAALKTGFRAVVTWETGVLEYSIGTGPVQQATASPLILEGLRQGATVCVRNGGAWHAMQASNALEAYDGAYTANFLILANEGTRADILEKGVERFAQLVWDATDGNVRVGTVITVFDHYDRQQETVQPCWNSNPGVHLAVFEAVLCERFFDVIFSHNVNPAAAGATYLDGIQEPDVPVWMNAVHEAGLLSGLYTEASQVREVGSVLAHEVGHYMFGAQDLYPQGGIVSTDCYQPSTGISIMSSSRDATEFDSESTPCSNASSAYEPTWSRMMARFPLILEREGPPLEGPEGDGGAFAYHTSTVGL